jgi:hypothetical protein
MSHENEIVLLGSLACLVKLREDLKIRKKRKTKKFGVHSIFLKRKMYGDYDNLLQELRLSDHYRFQNFVRMTPASFDKLLAIVGPALCKNSAREPISPGCRY